MWKMHCSTVTLSPRLAHDCCHDHCACLMLIFALKPIANWLSYKACQLAWGPTGSQAINWNALLQVLRCLSYTQTDFKDWEGLPKNPSICNGDKGMIGLVVQLAILLQIFGGRRGDDVLHMSYMHAKLEPQPTDLDDHVNSVGPSPATLIKFTMLMNKVHFSTPQLNILIIYYVQLDSSSTSMLFQLAASAYELTVLATRRMIFTGKFTIIHLFQGHQRMVSSSILKLQFWQSH